MGNYNEAYFLLINMRIVYKRKLKKEDFVNFDEQIIYYKDDNIAFIIVQTDNTYFVRKKKIFNNQLMLEIAAKTINQVLKIVE